MSILHRSKRQKKVISSALGIYVTSLLLLFPQLSCRSYRPFERRPTSYYVSSNKDLLSVGRVAFVELDNNSDYPSISADITEALFMALQKRQLFGLTVISQDNPTWRSVQLAPDIGYRAQNNTITGPPTNTFEELLAVRKALKCNAILTGTVTEYHPYPHMVIGLRLKLLDLRDGQLLWALEQVWDTADKKLEHQIKRYFESEMRSGFAPMREQLVVVSSLNFVKFVAHEVAATLKSK